MEEKRYFYDKLKTKKGVVIFAIISLIILTSILVPCLRHDMQMAENYTANCYEELCVIVEKISEGRSINEIENMRIPGELELITVEKIDKGEWKYSFRYEREELSDYYLTLIVDPTKYDFTFDSIGKITDSSFDISSREALLKHLKIEIYGNAAIAAIILIFGFSLYYVGIRMLSRDIKDLKKMNKLQKSK